MTNDMPSPCVGLCEEKTSDGQYCAGCLRTPTEVASWPTLSSEEKHQIFLELEARRKDSGLGVPVLGHPLATLDRIFLESLDDPKALWSAGVPGAVVSFCPSDGNLVISPRLWEYGGYVVGAYGGVRVVLDHKARKIKAIGTVDKTTGVLSRIDLCLYHNKAMMSQRTVLTEVGMDTEALRTRERRGILFDLGLGIRHLDYCVRVEDDELVRALREQVGKSVFDEGSPVNTLLEDEVRAPRVVLSRLGRVEVWGSADTASAGIAAGTAATFDPDLFSANVDRDPDSPVPAPLYPVMTLFPGSAIRLN